MERYSDSVINENGRAIAGASVRILDANGLVASIYSDLKGTPMANPVLTDSLGHWTFCAPSGMYSAEISLGNVLRYTLKDIGLVDPSSDLVQFASNAGAGLVGTTSGNTVQQSLDQLSSQFAGITGYTLPPASSSTLGGIKVGSGLAIDSNNVLTATGAVTGTVASVNGKTPVSGAVTLVTDDIAESGSPTNKWFTPARVLAAALTGLSTATNAVVVATDTVLAAIGKLQAQVNASATSISSNNAAITNNTNAIATKDTSGGYAGLTGFAINIKNAAGSVLSQLVSGAATARTWTFPDKSGTVAMVSDIPTSTGSVVLLGQATISSAVANIDFLSILAAGYSKCIIELEGITSSTADALCLVLAKAGAVDAALLYSALSFDGAANGNNSANAFQMPSVNGPFTLTFEIKNINSTTTPKAAELRGSVSGTQYMRAGVYTGANAVSGFRLFFSSGATFTAGAVHVYGVKNS